MKLSEELKAAIKRMPIAEKDKLLLRLIPKNDDLVRKLEFELLEGGDTAELRRDELKEEFTALFNNYPRAFYSPGYLMMDLRDCSGAITKHVKATKDKVGEIELNLLMLVQALERNEEKLQNSPARKLDTFNNYVIKRAVKIMGLIDKQHEDYRIDFQDHVQKLGQLIKNQPIMNKSTLYLGLNVEYLIEFE